MEYGKRNMENGIWKMVNGKRICWSYFLKKVIWDKWSVNICIEIITEY
jgi:hypothetical protein